MVTPCGNLRQMRICSWNIMHGGGTRIPRIVDALIAHDPDVIALSEFRTGPGETICASLAAKGWKFAASTNPAGNANGVCVISKTRLRRRKLCLAPAENVDRWLDV